MLAATSIAAQKHAAPGAKSAFTLGSDAQFGLRVAAPADQTAAAAMAARVLTVLRASPAIAQPSGYAVGLSRATGVSYPGFDTGMPWHAGVTGAASFFKTDAAGHATSQEGGLIPIRVLVNLERCDEGWDVHELDGGPPVIVQQVTGKFHGHPVYDGTCVMLTSRSAPPVVPVTQGRYLQLTILRYRAEMKRHGAQHDSMGGGNALQQFLRERPKREADMHATYVEMKKTNPAVAQQMLDASKQAEAQQEAALRSAQGNGQEANLQSIMANATAMEQHRIDSLQARLAAMSPAQRARQAMVVERASNDTSLAEEGEEGAIPLVSPNPAFFDRALGPRAVQSIVVYIDGLQATPNADVDLSDQDRVRATARLAEALPWAELEAMLHH